MIKNFLSKDSFWQQNFVLFVGTMLASFLNYLYNPILGRIMNVEDFGEAQLIVSVFNQTGILLSAFQLTTVVIMNQKSRDNTKLTFEFEKLAMFLASLSAIFLVAFSPLLVSNLKFESKIPFIVLGLSFLINVLYTFRLAILQAMQKFKIISYTQVLSSFLKIFISVILITFGMKSTGAIAGVSLALLIGAIIANSKLTNNKLSLSNFKNLFTLPSAKILKPLAPLLASVIIALGFITMLYAGDIILVKANFDREASGYYAGVATVARLIFFATMSFSWVLISKTGPKYTKTENKSIFWKTLLVTFIISGLGVLMFYVFPELIIKILIGSKFTVFAELLPKIGLVMMFAAIANVMFNYFIAHKRIWLIVLTASLSSLISIIYYSMSRVTLDHIINTFLLASVLAFVYLMLATLYYLKDSKLYGE